MHSTFEAVERNAEAWLPCLQPVDHQTEFHLTRASQQLLCTANDDHSDPLSPCTALDDDDECYTTGVVNIEGETAGKPALSTGISVTTTFDLQLDEHRKIPVPASEAYSWTESRRSEACTAREPDSIEELEEQVMLNIHVTTIARS